jgi:DNA-binding protein H-NS
MATKIDLDDMSVAQLRKHKDQVDQAIKERMGREQEEVKAKVMEVAEKSGFSLAELGFREKRKIVSKHTYTNPKDPNQTWSGRGRAPAWFTAAKMKKIPSSGASA